LAPLLFAAVPEAERFNPVLHVFGPKPGRVISGTVGPFVVCAAFSRQFIAAGKLAGDWQRSTKALIGKNALPVEPLAPRSPILLFADITALPIARDFGVPGFAGRKVTVSD
jgi:hypothetical protein